MAAIPSLHLPARSTTGTPVRAMTWLVLACAVAAGAAMAITSMVPAREIDPDLVVLLRAMAAIKALLVVAALAVVAWRFRFAVSPRIALAYGAAVAAMTFATVLIWSATSIGLAALVFHAGLFAGLYAAWRDDRIPQRRTGLLTPRP